MCCQKYSIVCSCQGVLTDLSMLLCTCKGMVATGIPKSLMFSSDLRCASGLSFNVSVGFFFWFFFDHLTGEKKFHLTSTRSMILDILDII